MTGWRTYGDGEPAGGAAHALLSGGEQTLTALALRFALFLGRPAPVCVLDEVDAALDDANVDRFCLLLADLADRGTRFLVITHHRLTMARMHRLFGVTMVALASPASSPSTCGRLTRCAAQPERDLSPRSRFSLSRSRRWSARCRPR